MTTTTRAAIAVVALLTLAGCVSAPNTGREQREVHP